MKILEFKNTKTKIKNSTYGLNGKKWETKKESVLKKEKQKLPYLNNREKINGGKKMNKISRACGAKTKDLTFPLSASQKQRRKAAG